MSRTSAASQPPTTSSNSSFSPAASPPPLPQSVTPPPSEASCCSLLRTPAPNAPNCWRRLRIRAASAPRRPKCGDRRSGRQAASTSPTLCSSRSVAIPCRLASLGPPTARRAPVSPPRAPPPPPLPPPLSPTRPPFAPPPESCAMAEEPRRPRNTLTNYNMWLVHKENETACACMWCACVWCACMWRACVIDSGRRGAARKLERCFSMLQRCFTHTLPYKHRPSAASVSGLKLLVYQAFSC